MAINTTWFRKYPICILLLGAIVAFIYFSFHREAFFGKLKLKLEKYDWSWVHQQNIIAANATSTSYVTAEETFLAQGNNTLIFLKTVKKVLGNFKSDPKFLFRQVRKANDVLIFKVRDINQKEISRKDFLAKLASFGFVRGTKIPPVLHYNIRFESTDLEFHHALGMLSAFHVLKPRAICFWHAQPSVKMTGLWQYLYKNFSASGDSRTSVYFVQTYKPSHIYGYRLKYNEHQGDMLRYEILLGLGGYYFDLDVLSIRPWEELLRGHDFVIGRERDDGLGNSIMASTKSSLFMRVWHLAYQFYDKTGWAELSIQLPHYMSLVWPQLLHVDPKHLCRPNWTGEELKLIYGKERKWKWRENYLVHLWYRKYNKKLDFESIKYEDNAFGDIVRWVLFGSPEIKQRKIASSTKT